MIVTLFLMCMAITQATTSPTSQATSKATVEATIHAETAAQLLKVKRIYVDSFGDDPTSKQLQAMIVNALAASKKFIITEDKDKADALLKGNTGQYIHQEALSSSESTEVRSAAVSESSHSTETVNEVSMAVRLVAADGDVIWTTTKESKGAKYKGPSADAAEQVVKQLLGDLARLQSPNEKGSPK